MHWCSRMMLQPRWSCEVMKWMWIDWLDLPKLTTLRGGSNALRLPRHITLESDSYPFEMTFRHAPSQQCVSSKCISLHEWRHNKRKYSLHPSLTNRHRRSSVFLQLITKRHVTPLFVPHTSIHLRAHSAAFERALSLCEHGSYDDSQLKWWKSNQNRGSS